MLNSATSSSASRLGKSDKVAWRQSEVDGAGTVRTNSQYTKPTQISLNGKNTAEYLFQNEIAPFLRSKGYKYSTGRINILCSPAVNEGPPVALWYGRLIATLPLADCS